MLSKVIPAPPGSANFGSGKISMRIPPSKMNRDCSTISPRHCARKVMPWTLRVTARTACSRRKPTTTTSSCSTSCRPNLDGWGLLERLRQNKKTPVLMLTARDAHTDRVRGLDGGRMIIW